MKTFQQHKHALQMRDEKQPLALTGLAMQAIEVSIEHAHRAISQLQEEYTMALQLKEVQATAEMLASMMELLAKSKLRSLAIKLADAVVNLAEGLSEYETSGRTAAVSMTMAFVPDALLADEAAEKQACDTYVKNNIKRKKAA